MKRLIVIVFFMITNLGFTQSYKPLLEEGKFWDVFFYHFQNIGCYAPGQRQFIEGDSLINGVSYKIIRAHNFLLSGPCIAEPYQILEPTHIIGFMREDIVEKKVYTYFDPNIIYPYPFSIFSNEEILTYDFNLQEDDIFQIPYLDNMTGTIDTIEDFIYTDGSIVKKFNFQNHLALNEDYYIEGIGGTEGLMFPFGFDFETYSFLFDYGITMDINSLISNNQLNISPNPFDDYIHLKFTNKPSEINRVEIYNVLGENLLSVSNLNQENFIDLKFQKGIYILCVISNDGKIFTKKLIKE